MPPRQSSTKDNLRVETRLGRSAGAEEICIYSGDVTLRRQYDEAQNAAEDNPRIYDATQCTLVRCLHYPVTAVERRDGSTDSGW